MTQDPASASPTWASPRHAAAMARPSPRPARAISPPTLLPRPQAFQTLSDRDKRAAYDQGGDIKSRRGGGESDGSDGSDEEQQQSLREEIERKYFPERCAARLTMPPPGALPCSLS